MLFSVAFDGPVLTRAFPTVQSSSFNRRVLGSDRFGSRGRPYLTWLGWVVLMVAAVWFNQPGESEAFNSAAEPHPSRDHVSGRIVGLSGPGTLQATCSKGSGRQSLSVASAGYFSLLMDKQQAPCLVEWRGQRGEQWFALLTQGHGLDHFLEVSAASHLWVHFLRHVPVQGAGAGTSVPDWFSQAPVQRLLSDEEALGYLAESSFLRALQCMVAQSSDAHARVPHNLNELLYQLRAQAWVDDQGRYSMGAMTILVRAAMASRGSKPASCAAMRVGLAALGGA